MMQVDSALAAQFRIKKEQAQLAYEEDVRFKVCVLELFEIYVKSHSTNPLVLDLIIPLLNTAKTSSQFSERKDVTSRALAIIKNKYA
jgi:hypothetical protein